MPSLTFEQKIEKLRQRTDFAMYKQAGNNRVRTIVIRAFRKSPYNADKAFEFAEAALNKLSYEKNYGEAMDTAVRNSVHSTLEGIIGRG